MDVHFTPEQEAKLNQPATTVGTDARDLVQEAALRLIEENGRFRTAVRAEFIEEAEMDARLEKLLRS